jgi:UDPglucose 6-dehydrogenase
VISKPTGFLGLSHLGLITSIGWASFGQPVRAVDVDEGPVESLNRGDLPVHEPLLAELFTRHRSQLTFSTDPCILSACPLVIVARDVPTDHQNHGDPSVILDLIDAALPHFRQGVTIALMSQVPPGFTRQLGEMIRTRRPNLLFRLYYWIETLVFGNAVERFLRPERMMIGCADPTAPFPSELHTALRRFECPILPMSYESAELTKIAINLYLYAGVTYANTLADLCEAVGANWAEMMPALRLDRRIGSAAYIRPSLGVAGGNLERDMITLCGLCQQVGVDAAFIETMLQCNGQRYQWIHRKLSEHVFAEVAFPTIAVWGLAYKKNTRSTRNSVAVRVIEDLRERADMRAWDPVVAAVDVDVAAKIVTERDDALADADCLLILTDWDEFGTLSGATLKTMRRPLVIDCVGVVDQSRSDLTGVQYVRMGQAS